VKGLRGLGRPSLLALAKALSAGRLRPPYTTSAVGQYVSGREQAEAAAELERLAESGMQTGHIGAVLRLVADEREAAQRLGDRIDLVWSGPELVGARSRSTSTVVRELFASAKRSVLVASYALDTGEKAKALFAPLAECMDTHDSIRVQIFANVSRPYRSDTADSILLRQFADSFRNDIWPGTRMPEVFHDPRALSTDPGPRACLHAKCVVIDDQRALITSANFTEAAHDRNIEAGVVVEDASVASALRRQFDSLVAEGVLMHVPGI